MRNSLKTVNEQLQNLTPQLSNISRSLYEPHVTYLGTKLEEISEQLETLEVNRVKRGLIDGLGSVIKSISGNLDYTDALKYDNAIAILKQNDNNLVAEMNHQISLSKQWVSRSSNVTDKIVENQGKIEKIINSILASNVKHETDTIKYAHLAQLLMILGDNIDNLSKELDRLQNLLAFIRAKSIHNSVLNHAMFKDMMNRLGMLYNKDQFLEISFREYFDIIRLGYYYNGNKIVIVIQFPILYPTNFILYKLSLAPNYNNKVLIPTYPFIAVHEKDLLYMETECPKYSHGHLCEDNLSHHHGQQSDCIRQLILQQKINESCQFTSVILSSEAMEQLDDQHFIVSFPKPTKVRLTCSEDYYRMLKGSYLSIIPRGCALRTTSFTASNRHDQTKGKILKIMDLPTIKENVPMKTIQLDTIDLGSLHSSNSEITLQEPVTLQSSNTETIYHTTIPVYILLSGACVLIIIIILRRRRLKKLVLQKATEAIDIKAKDKEACNTEIDPASPSTLFSTRVFK